MALLLESVESRQVDSRIAYHYKLKWASTSVTHKSSRGGWSPTGVASSIELTTIAVR
jgi:hypothetical protein